MFEDLLAPLRRDSGDPAAKYMPALPLGVALILSLPVLGFTYLWDDYSFLTNAMFYQLRDWLPRSLDPFYRPISRGIYFTLLSLMGPSGALVGHILNLGLLSAILLILASFVARIAGWRAGMLSAVILAGLASVPSLVGWVSCDQDLLAMLFVMLALHHRLERKSTAAFLCTAAGLLSKETTLAVVPAIALFDWVAGRRPAKILASLGVYGVLVAVWAAIHPAIRILLGRALQSGATGYVGLEHAERWPSYIGRYVLALFNIPTDSPLPAWPVYGVPVLVGSFGLVWFALRRLHSDPPVEEVTETRWPIKRILFLSTLLAIGPLLLTATMIRGWQPYYAAFPALGSSVVAGLVLDRVPNLAQLIALGVFLTLGVWSRGDIKDLEETRESNFHIVSSALRKVDDGFRRLYPTFEPGTQVLLSTQAAGAGGLYTHMYKFQVLRIWYGDRSLSTYRPEARPSTPAPEVLAAIAPDRDVIDINPNTLHARSASRREPDYDVCETAVRAYTVGLAGSDDTDRAIAILLHMPEVKPGLAIVHRRMAAMFYLAENRPQEAQAILDSTTALPRGVALADLRAVLAEQPKGRVFDGVALTAFGIDPNDVEATRELMRWFADNKYAEVARRFASRVQRLVPGDREAAAIDLRMEQLIEKRRRELQPLKRDSLPNDHQSLGE